MPADNTIEILILARDLASDMMDGIGDNADSMSSKFVKAGTQITTATAGISGALISAVGQAVTFESSMTDTAAVLNLTGEAQQKLSKDILDFARHTRAGPQAVAEAYYDIVGGVADVTSHMAILTAATATAEAGNADLGSTTASLISTMNAYKLTAKDTGMVSDVMTNIVGKGVGTMDQFAAALPAVTGLASSLGISFQEVGGAMAFMTTKGYTASSAATQMGAMMSTLINPNTKMKAVLEEMGFATGQAALKQLGFAETMKLVAKTAGTDLAGALGSSEALLGVVALSGEDAAAALKAFDDSVAGATERARAIQLGSVAAQMDIFKSTMSAIAITIGATLLPAINKLLQGIQPVLDVLFDFASTHTDIVTALVGVAGAISLLGPVLLGVGAAIAVITSPLTGIIVLMGALTYAFIRDWGGIRTLVESVVGRVTATIGRLMENITTFTEDVANLGVFDAIRNAFTGEFNFGENWIEGVFSALFGADGQATGPAREMAKAATDTIYKVVGPAIDFLEGLTGKLHEGFIYAESGVYRFNQAIAEGLSPIRALAETGVVMITGFLWGIGAITEASDLQVFYHTLIGIIDGIQQVFETAWTAITNAVARLTEGFSYARQNLAWFNTQVEDGVAPFIALANTAAAALASIAYGVGLIDLSEVGQVRFQMLQFIETFSSSITKAMTIVSGIVSSMKLVWALGSAGGAGFFDNVRTEISVFSTRLLDFLGLSEETSSAISDWMTTAVTNVERVFNSVSGVVNSVIDWIRSLSVGGGDIMSAIGPIYEVGSWLLAMTNPFSLAFKVLTELGVDFIGIIEDVASGITTFFSSLADGASVGDAIGNVLGPSVTGPLQAGADIITGVFSTITRLLGDLWTFVQPSLEALGNWFTVEFLPGVGELLETRVMPLLQSFGQFLGDLWAIVGPALEALATWFLYEALPAITGFITEVVLPAIGTLIDALTRVWTDVSPFLLQLADWFINTAMPTVVDFINTIIIPAVQKFIDIVKGIWNTVSPFLTLLYEWFITNGLPWIMTKIDEGRATIQRFIDIIKGIWGFVSAGVEEFKVGLKAMVDWVDLNIVQPIVNGVNNIINGFKGIWDNIKTGVESFKNGVMGVVNDISNAIQGVMEALGLAQKGKEDLVVSTTTNDAGDIIEHHSPADGNGTGYAVNLTQRDAAMAGIKDRFEKRDGGGPGTAGTPYIINPSAGPEVFIPQTNGQFIPNIDQLLSGGSSGNTYHVAVSVSERDIMSSADAEANGETLGKKIAQELGFRG